MGENKTNDFVRTTLEELQKSDCIFGAGDIVSIDFTDDKDKAFQLLSQVTFATVRIQNSDGVRTDFPVVVKSRVQNECFEEMGSFTVDVFLNEVTVYRDLLPELNGCQVSLVPKCYYSRVGREKDDVTLEPIIILEDLRSRGYKVQKDKLFLESSGVKLALKKLGQFHGLGYRYKKKHSDLFKKCSTFKKLKFSALWVEMMQGFLPFYLNRYVARLIKENNHKEILERFQEKLKDLNAFFDYLTSAKEPFATIIHGDFNKNNMAFKYDSQDQPTDVVFFDLQNSAYGDPTLDLCFFLYMNTDQATRDNHWSDFMATYWSGVTSIAPEPGFTFEEWLENLATRAVIGYVEPAFFTPTSLDPEKAFSVQMDQSMSVTEKTAALDSLGGEEAYDIVNKILLDMIDRGFVKTYLENSKI